MKRIIKFRGWIKDENKMSYMNEWFAFMPDYIQYADQGFWANNLNAEEKHKERLKSHNIECKDDFVLMQFTGLKDKNGQEIYEEDIVKCGYGTGKVIFKYGCFFVEWINDNYSDMELLFSADGRSERSEIEVFEVIGNIYQNPQLLETVQK